MGGSEDARKINWIKWDKICRPIEECGVGIKNLRDFNLSLLGKWVWKIRKERSGLWTKALRDRYGGTDGIPITSDKFSSLWWRDICSLDIGDRENAEEYSVKESYNARRAENRIETTIGWAEICLKSVSSKVLCLVWRLLQNRLPIKDNLVRRRVIHRDSNMCM